MLGQPPPIAVAGGRAELTKNKPQVALPRGALKIVNGEFMLT